MSRIGKFIETKSRLVFAQGWDVGEGAEQAGATAVRKEFLFGVMKMFKVDCGIVAQLYIQQNPGSCTI